MTKLKKQIKLTNESKIKKIKTKRMGIKSLKKKPKLWI